MKSQNELRKKSELLEGEGRGRVRERPYKFRGATR